MSYQDIKKYMTLSESLDEGSLTDETFPNSPQGVKDFMLEVSTITERQLEGAEYIPDPEVDGVWMIKLAKPVDEFRAVIVYLDDGDFEMVQWQDSDSHTDKEDGDMYKESDEYIALDSVAESVLQNDISGETITTSGDGLWSDVQKTVILNRMEVDQHSPSFGELRVYFDTNSWNVDRDGLIYTDKAFLEGIKDLLNNKGYDTSKIDYSEQGMQGNDYVSFDVGESFLQSTDKETTMQEDDEYARMQHGPEDYMGGQRFVGGESQDTGDTVTKTVVGHRDDETKMMQRELQKIEKYAAELSSMMDQIQDGDYPHWWQAKLVKAGDYISTIKHYLEAELDNMNEPQMPTDLDSVGFDLSYDDLIAPDQERF